MPRTVDEGFRDFLSKLRASVTESDGAKKHRASIKACLENSFGLRRFTRIGSFGNGTSISGYSDVDYLASLPSRLLKKGIPMPETVQFRDRLNVESTSCEC